MEIITHKDIINLHINKNQCFSWVKEALQLKENSFLPPKCSIKPGNDIFFTSMPCLIPELDVYGLKMVSRIPNQQPVLNSSIMLYRYSTGELLAIMDGNWITAMRTGAVATLSMIKSAKNNFSTIGCIGLGNTCESTLDMLFSQLPEHKIILRLLKYKNHAQRIIERYNHLENVSFEIIDDLQSLISDSDIILSCVTSVSEDFGKDEWYKEGCTVIPVHTMGFQNCDFFFDKFIIDDYEHVKKFKNFDKFKEYIEIKDILKSDSIRNSDNERIIAYNVGIALHDVYYAYKIFTLIHGNTACASLNEIKENYWL